MKPAKTEFVLVGTSQIAYRRMGKGFPLVLLQRFRGKMGHWDPRLLERLAAHHEVIFFDYPGTGDSGGRFPESLAAMTEFLFEFTENLGLEKFHLFGWSMGGMIAQEFVVRHPEKVAKLVLAGTTPPIGSSAVRAPTEEWKTYALRESYGALEFQKLFFTDSAAGARAALEHFREVEATRAIPLDIALQQGNLIRSFLSSRETFQALRGVMHPAFVANGAKDEICFPDSNSLVLKEQLGNARFKSYPDSAHGFLFQHGAEFAADVRAFLSEK